ncbi:MAG: hypothetical protein AB1896_22320, partial [Thermodesulfobacteriota bacterium]
RTIAFLGRAGVPHTLLTDIGPLAEAGSRVEADPPTLPAPPVLTRVIQAHVGGVSVLDSHTALASLSHALLSAVSWFLPESRKRLEEVERAWHGFYRSPM